MSWLFLAGDRVLKLKKPVRYGGFLDYSTLEARRHYCNEEVRLNRRLAPTVYLGVLAVTEARGRLRLEGAGRIVEWLVKMRRLPEDQMLDRKIASGSLAETEIRLVGEVLADFYHRLPPALTSPQEYRQRLQSTITGNYQVLSNPYYGLDQELIEQLHQVQFGFLENYSALLNSRVLAERIVEGHGDLRPEHVCLEPKPAIFDCLEFNRDFRILDVLDELSFLAMECELFGSHMVGEIIYGTYFQKNGDQAPRGLLDFYKVMRACIRAKLAIWHMDDVAPPQRPHWKARGESYLALAKKYA